MKKQLDLVSKLLTLTKFQSCYCKYVILFWASPLWREIYYTNFYFSGNIVGKCSKSAGTKLY